jgi:hypothetical protein
VTGIPGTACHTGAGVGSAVLTVVMFMSSALEARLRVSQPPMDNPAMADLPEQSTPSDQLAPR